MRIRAASSLLACLFVATAVNAQLAVPPAPWRGAGAPPCVGSDGGVYQCVPGPGVTAVRAGHLFDSKSGKMLSQQVVLLDGERITDVGAEGKSKFRPAPASSICAMRRCCPA